MELRQDETELAGMRRVLSMLNTKMQVRAIRVCTRPRPCACPDGAPTH